MNIAFILPYLADRYGGPVAVAKGMGGSLAGMGHEVSYWATATNGDRHEPASMSGAHVFDTDWPHAWRRSKGFRRGLSDAIASTDILQIQSVWTYPSYAAGRIAYDSDVPYILLPAGALQPWALGNGRVKRLKKAAYFRLVARSLMDRAACVQTASVQEAEQVQRLGYAGPVAVIPNGVDIDALSDGRASDAEVLWPALRDRPVVLFMSRLSPEKGLDLLIPAWDALVKSPRYEEAILVIAGPDYRGYGETVKAMIDEHGVASHVLLTGMVQGARKASLLRRADVFILPSYTENFGIVIAEALACGTPVITTTHTPWEQLRTVDAGVQVPPTRRDVDQALRDLLDMPASRRREMGQRGSALVHEQYTWDRVAAKFLRLCDCVLTGKPIPLHPEPMESVRV
jgi:glycosyltransferase involved in cell wall biosynthesis